MKTCIDLSLLVQALSSAEPGTSVDESEVNSYLLTQVLKPIRRNGVINLDAIDYAQFGLEEMRALFGWNETTERCYSNMERTNRVLCETRPAHTSVRMFC